MTTERARVCVECGWVVGAGATENADCPLFHSTAAGHLSVDAVDFRGPRERMYPAVDESDAIATAILDEAFDCGADLHQRVTVHKFGANRIRAFIAREIGKTNSQHTSEVLAIEQAHKAERDALEETKDTREIVLWALGAVLGALLAVAVQWVTT